MVGKTFYRNIYQRSRVVKRFPALFPIFYRFLHETVIRHAFEDLHLKTLWCGYFDGNDKSRRAQEKCGFIYHHTDKDIHWKLMDDIRTEHITRLTREEWEPS